MMLAHNLFLAVFLLSLGTTFGLNVESIQTQGNESQWSTLNVALVQYPLVGYLSVDQLFSKVKTFVLKASQDGAQVVLIPELFTLDLLDFSRPVVPQFDPIIDELYPTFMIEMQKLADELNIYVLAGSTPVKVKTRIRNRSFLFGPHSTPVFQDKIFLTPDEVEWGWEGADTLRVIETPWGKTAIVICYDSEFPLISQTLAQHEINLILIPSMTGEEGFTRVRWAAQSRTVEHLAYVCVTGISGDPAPSWGMKAQAAVLGPSLSGFTPLIAEGRINQESEVVFAALNMSALVEAKMAGDYYPALDQKGVASITVEVVDML